ncbi:MAG: DUF1425 domain-containing protein [Kiritimatiellales bacterium]|jgi:uncharacterized protein YcfL
MKISRNLIVLAAVAAGLTGLTSCRNTSGTIVNTDHLTGQSMIIEENGRLAHRVNVVKISYDEVNGFKRVNFALASDRNRRTRIDYRICWFDVNGMEIDSQTKPYRNLILEGRDAVTVTGVANSPAAVSSKLRIRETSQAK